MKRNALMITLAGVAIAVAAWTLVPAGTHAPAKPSSPTAAAVATTQTAPVTTTNGPPVSAGYVVHLDGNGKVTTQPQAAPDAEFNAQLEKMINTSSEGLQQVTTPNGVMVRLDGRFQSTMAASKDADGKVVVPCLTNENDVKAYEPTGAAQAAQKE